LAKDYGKAHFGVAAPATLRVAMRAGIPRR
jgi:hypothetical protein